MPRKTHVISGQMGLLDFGLSPPAKPAAEEAVKTPPTLPPAILQNQETETHDEQLSDHAFGIKGPEPMTVKRAGAPTDYFPTKRASAPIDAVVRRAANIKALHLLEKLQTEGRYASDSEQEALVRYTGWQGMHATKKEQNELNAVLIEEFTEERAEQLLALPQYPYHIGGRVTDTIFKALKHMGFVNGNILVTGTGSGSVLRSMPEAMRRKSRITVEQTDEINGRLMSFLYPNIEVASQKEGLFESFYDLALGIVPFEPAFIGKNEVTMPAYACTMARAFSALRVGGMFGMLVDNRHVLDMLCSKANPFDICPTHLAFRGGFQFDSDAVGDGQSYALLVFQKCHKKNEVMVNGVFKRDTISVLDGKTGKQVNARTTEYFAKNPSCVLGAISIENGSLVLAGYTDDERYDRAVAKALKCWNAKKCYAPVRIDAQTESSRPMPADPSVKNYSFVLHNGLVYQRVDSRMICQKLEGIRLERVKGMIRIRNLAKTLVQLQFDNCSDDALLQAQEELTDVYDRFVKSYGPVTCLANTRLFREDADFTVLTALEYMDEEEKIHKSDLFTKRTILARHTVTACDTIDQAFMVCIDQKGIVDIPHIASLAGVPADEVIRSLAGRLIFRNPPKPGESPGDDWISHDVYLSGNTRRKLAQARDAVQAYPEFQTNVEALECVIPPLIPAKDIFIKMDAPYIPTKLISDFIYEQIGGGNHGAGPEAFEIYQTKTGRKKIKPRIVIPREDPAFHSEFGTEKYSALKLIEKMMNTSQVIAYKTEKDPVTGEKTRVKDHKHTVVLVEKVEKIQDAFRKWVFQDPVREALLVDIYNQTFNADTIPKYDGSHLTFPGMTAAITLMQHQKNTVYRIVMENGALVAHVVGSGKTITLLTAGQELRRLGRINKPLYVVPNNLIAQWGGEMMRLYPAANILLADPDDMQKDRRERFMGRMATGSYDAIIMGASSFMHMPPPYHSVVRAVEDWRQTILQHHTSLNSSAQSMVQKMKEELLVFLRRVQCEPYTMEDLGIDYLFIDESHEYKNLVSRTKQGDVRGLSNTAAVKCTDLYYKTKYMNQLHGYKGGYVFATGTPITNTITEMYSLKRYFIEPVLLERGILSLDDWLSMFGEITTDWELPPEGLTQGGKGYRRVTRVRSFANVPEMMRQVLQFMDTVTADQIDMDTPAPIRKTETCPASSVQMAYMQELVQRAADIRKGNVDRRIDNMLLVTGDGRKCALDARLIDPAAEMFSEGKVSRCAKNVWDLYQQYDSLRATQLVFCDISVPKDNGFSIYRALKDRLIQLGIPEIEIGFAHDYNTPSKKASMRIKMQTGKLRVLIGSTATIGQGVNIQRRLIALHHLDVPWVPKDLEQRDGRGIRTGNMHSQIYVFSYVTEGSFDSYMYQLVRLKAKLISQIMRGDFTQRVIEDTDTRVLNYAEIEAAATGNTLYLDRAKVEGELVRLETLKRDFDASKETMKQNVYRNLPRTIESLERQIPLMEKDWEALQALSQATIAIGDGRPFVLGSGSLQEARNQLETYLRFNRWESGKVIGQYCGLKMVAQEVDSWSLHRQRTVILQGEATHRIEEESSVAGGLSILNLCRQILETIPRTIRKKKEALKANTQALEASKGMLNDPFEYEEKLQNLYAERDRLALEIAKCA